MSVEQLIDDFIGAGLRPLGLSFGPVAVRYWRRKVFGYMTAEYGRISSTPDILKIAFAKARKRRRENDGN